MTIGLDVSPRKQAQKFRVAKKMVEVEPADVFGERVERPIGVKMLKKLLLLITL